MEYGRLIREAWQITWRHPFLWVLGLFAGGTAGVSLGGGGGRAEPRGTAAPLPDVDVTGADVARWATDHVGLIVGVLAAVLLVVVALLVTSLIAQGGMAGATADLANGRPSSFRRAWRTGLHLFWRYAGLWLLLIAAVMLIGLLIAGFVALTVGATAWIQNGVWVIAPALLVALLLVMIGIAAGVVVSIVVPYAQRAIAVRDIGPLAGLRDGWQVLRAHPGASLLVWLLNLALTIGAGLAMTVAMLAVGLVLAIPALALWAAFELSTPTIAYLAVAAVVALGVLLTLVAVANTFFWSYWTLAYVRLEGDNEGQLAAP
jgi:hypothetical protein